MPAGCSGFIDKERPAHCLRLGEDHHASGPQHSRWYLGWLVSMNVIIAAGVAGIVFWRWKCCRKTLVLDDEEEDGDTKSADLLLEIVSGSAIKYKIQALHNGPPVTIGRLPENHLAIPSDFVSGDHAHLEWNSDSRQWFLWDNGSMNGTALNDLTISTPDRTPGDRHAVNPGDSIILAERITISVKLLDLFNTHTDQDPESSTYHKVAPRSGSMHAPGPQAPVSLMDPHGQGQKPKPQTYQFYCPGLHANVAIASQVGSSHWQFANGSEDVAFWETPFANFSKTGLFSVCDGHVGDSTSKELRDRLPQALGLRFRNKTSLLADGEDLTKKLNEFFPSLDRELKSQDGSTATIMLAERLLDGSCAFQVANVGDSTGILIEGRECKALTADHRIVSADETKRLKESNAPISPRGTRLHNLNLARVMGDHDLKQMSSTLIADPFVSEVATIPADKSAMVLMASDGLWDGLRPKQIIDVLQADSSGSVTLVDNLATLISQSASKGISDDITVVLIHFLPQHQFTNS